MNNVETYCSFDQKYKPYSKIYNSSKVLHTGLVYKSYIHIQIVSWRIICSRFIRVYGKQLFLIFYAPQENKNFHLELEQNWSLHQRPNQKLLRYLSLQLINLLTKIKQKNSKNSIYLKVQFTKFIEHKRLNNATLLPKATYLPVIYLWRITCWKRLCRLGMFGRGFSHRHRNYSYIYGF